MTKSGGNVMSLRWEGRSLVCSVLAGALVLAGCQTMSNPQTASVVAQPDTPVVKNMTSFTNALRCMDDLFLAYGKRDIIITSDGLPDQTGEVRAGTKEMMISALSKMTAKSNAFRFVDVERSGDAVFYFNQILTNHDTQRKSFPSYYIRGAFTQVDRGILQDNQGIGVAFDFVSLGYEQDQLVSLISMDLNMGKTTDLEILPGISSTNTIATVKSGRGAEVEGLVPKANIYLNFSNDRAQGTHAAARTLVELGLIELLGKFTRVPYWRCLEIESTNPEMMAQIRDWYDQMSPADRVRLTASALRGIGYYQGADTTETNRALVDAINRYKAEKDLIANGRIDFDLYYRFIADDMARRGPSGGQPLQAPPVSPSLMASDSETAGYDPLGLTLTPVTPSRGSFRAGDSLAIDVSVSQTANLYCYYQASDGTIARVFPNRFDSNPTIKPGLPQRIPTKGRFSIVLDKTGTEENVACVATQSPYQNKKIPSVLLQPDLQPLKESSLGDIIYQHQGLDKMKTSIQTVTIAVQ